MKVSSSRVVGHSWENLFECKLLCGHTGLAYGRKPKGYGGNVAPKTCKCLVCEKGKGSNVKLSTGKQRGEKP